MAARETHKGRRRWTRWSGTPTLIGAIARKAEDLAAAGGPRPEVRITVEAAAWDSEFITVEDFEAETNAADLADIETIEVKAYRSGRVISVAFRRPPRRQPEGAPPFPVASLNVAAPDRHWVQDVTEEMIAAIAAGVPRTVSMFRRVAITCLVIGATGVALLIGGSEGHVHWLEVCGVVILAIGFGTAILIALMESFLPRLELLPEGKETRRSKALRWMKLESSWAVRLVIASLVGSGVTLLIQHLR